MLYVIYIYFCIHVSSYTVPVFELGTVTTDTMKVII